MKWIRSIDLKEFESGCDAFGSAATDVSAISLKSTGCQKEHIYFNQNAETSVAAEPNASQPVANYLKSRCKLEFTTERLICPTTARLLPLGSHRCFSVLAKTCRMPKRSRRFSQNAETSVAAEPNASSRSKSRCKMVNLQRIYNGFS